VENERKTQLMAGMSLIKTRFTEPTTSDAQICLITVIST